MGNCSGRSRVRRIFILTCIQRLVLQFLHVIWSTPTNFALFKKHLIIPRLIVNKYTLQVSRTLKTSKAFKQGLKYNQISPPDSVFTPERSSLFTGIVFKFHMHARMQQAKKQFASKRTFGHYRQAMAEFILETSYSSRRINK